MILLGLPLKTYFWLFILNLKLIKLIDQGLYTSREDLFSEPFENLLSPSEPVKGIYVQGLTSVANPVPFLPNPDPLENRNPDPA